MIRRLIATLAITIAAPLSASEVITYPSEDDFEDTVFSVESAILDAGLVIDFTPIFRAQLRPIITIRSGITCSQRIASHMLHLDWVKPW